MINSRSLDDLVPPAKQRAEAFIAAAKAKGIDLLVTSTYRDNESQDALYAQGRTTPGNIVTRAKAGESWHNWRCALDVVPIVNGKAIWDDQNTWTQIGEIGVACGLEWAGNWVTFKEFPHFQYTGGLTLDQLNQGATIA
jgi:peptidoglycan L-alanyl-D-glutamate endopeptidase CwlK